MGAWMWMALVLIILIDGLIAVALWLVLQRRQRPRLSTGRRPELVMLPAAAVAPRPALEAAPPWPAVPRRLLLPLAPAERARFNRAWEGLVARFADAPATTIVEADGLIARVLAARGYRTPADPQATDVLAVEHPLLLVNYRAAHRIALATRRGDACTEDLRRALVHFRALFEILLDPHPINA